MKKHAYLIIAHNEPQILKVLLQLLDHPRNDIYLHIDQRATRLRQEIKALQLSFSRLCLLQHPIAVYWGHISQIQVELRLFETAHAQGDYAYYHLLSGVDLPIKKQEEIHRYFDEHEGEEFVGFWTAPYHQHDSRRKVHRKYIYTKYYKSNQSLIHNATSFARNMYLVFQKAAHYHKKFPYQPQKGYNWISITNDFCNYILRYKNEILKLYHHALCADEIFVQTLIWNSPFRHTIHNREDVAKGSMRAIDWQRGNPYVWQASDVEDLLASPYLFARKFSGKHLDAVHQIAEHLSNNHS